MIFSRSHKQIMRARLFFGAMIFFILFTAMFIRGAAASGENAKRPRVDLVGNSIYIDGKKFFIKGVGYSPFRPDKWPGSEVPLDIAEQDFKRIRDAGFNTLRVWSIMPEAQLELAEKYGLKVIQAVALKSSADFGYEGFIRMAESKVKRMCRISKDHPNVIMYLVMNEPHPSAILKPGLENTLNLYKRLAEIIREEDPGRPVSMANAYWTLWLDQSVWDVVSFNAYSYTEIAEDMGYANFIKNLKSLHSPDRPMVITEAGLSVSPEGPGNFGYGGNTQEEQAEGVVNYFRDFVKAGVAGGCIFEWNDEWWKAGEAGVHDYHPEEWFGIIGIEKKEDSLGAPRKAYYDIKEEMKLVITRPAEGCRMLNNLEVEVSASEGIRKIQYSVDGGEWKDLFISNGWWRSTADLSGAAPGLHLLTVKGLDGEKEIVRTVDIIKCKDKKDLLPPLKVELATDKASYKNGEVIKIKARLLDREGAPIESKRVKLGLFSPINSYSKEWEGLTNERGFFSSSVPVIGDLDEWYYVFWAAAEAEDYGYKTTAGKISYVRADIGKGFPVKRASAAKAKDINVDGIIDESWLKTEKIRISPETNFAEGGIKGPEDLSAEARVLWDDGNIYILLSVKDDFPIKNQHTRHDLWKGDCAELFISVNPEKIPDEGYADSDFQILIGNNGRMWIPGQRKAGVRNDVPVLSQAAAKIDDDGYVLEAKINVANFWDKPFRVFTKGTVLGFDIAIGDADETGMRDSKIVWNGTERGYKDSSVWGRLTLR